MGATALIDSKSIEHLLFGSLWNLRSIEIDTLLGRLTFELLQFALVATPFVGNAFSTFETAHRDDHSCYLDLWKDDEAILGGSQAASLARAFPIPPEIP